MASERAPKADKIFKKIACGSGSFYNFLTTTGPVPPQSGPSPPSLFEHLIAPFSATVGSDGLLRKCRLAGPDRWDNAVERIQRQSHVVGGPNVRQRGVDSGVTVEGVPVHIRKVVVCSREGHPVKSSSSSSSSSQPGQHSKKARTNSQRVSTECNSWVMLLIFDWIGYLHYHGLTETLISVCIPLLPWLLLVWV